MSVDSAEAMAGKGHTQWPPETVQPKPLEKIDLRIVLPMLYPLTRSLVVLYPREHCAESLTQKLEDLRSGSDAASKSVFVDKRWALSMKRFRDEL